MMRVEVFKTNVQEAAEAAALQQLLARHFPDVQIDFDLEDCDKILRMAGRPVAPAAVILLVEKRGYRCSVLE